ncbi:MAG: Cysteine-rich secretory protein family protein [candidate division WS2 bacterium ADurb.Bin280]|uniref:Cysteine-rich secretory protein family protein n=1 Tax=candidate division WS2 bacterium ADurb.Bin280 TaxID=1852829 RepID=A0A1V5SF12_9BACT|nr:MAG: Cysteine-rich secretory protein family protein [candidate division WS2 bacterium ADurb.Bin280]
MNFVDIFFALFLLVLAALAVSRGFFATIKALLVLLVTYPIAFYLVDPISSFLRGFDIIENLYLPAIIFSLLLIIFYSLAYVLLGAIFVKYEKFVSRWLAVIPALFVCLILFCAICQVTFVFFGKDYILDNSLVCSEVLQINPLGYLSDYSLVTKDALSDDLILSGEEQEVIFVENLPDVAKQQKDLEAKMVKMVNSARESEEKNSLQRDEELDELAFTYAQEIIKSKRFSHLDSWERLPIERAKSVGLVTDYFGENLAISSDIYRVFEGFANSERHRQNIVQPLFTRIGVCVMKVGSNILVVQEFSN